MNREIIEFAVSEANHKLEQSKEPHIDRFGYKLSQYTHAFDKESFIATRISNAISLYGHYFTNIIISCKFIP